MPLAGWNDYLPLTVSVGGTSALSYYQVPVTLTGSQYAWWAARGAADGSDLRVTEADGTPLKFWVEWIDSANSALYLLVKVPRVAAGGSRALRVYAGNPSATTASDPATTIGPSAAATGPADILTQSDYAGYVSGSPMVRLQHQSGANASHNGDIVITATVAAQGDQVSQAKIALMRSTDDGATWSKATILTPADSSHSACVRAIGELADGTIVIAYSYDTNAKTLNGTCDNWIAKSTDAGQTWTNLSTTPSNRFAVPWTYGTDPGGIYGKFSQDSAGNVLLTAYGKIGAAQYKSYLFACPAASDPANGTNWSVRGVIFDGVADSRVYDETDVLNVGGSNWIAITRTDNAAVPCDFYRATSSDDGATWSAASAVGMPPASPAAVNNPVSPFLITLASGSILLAWGARQGTAKWGTCLSISTDGGATFVDRPACGAMLHAAAGNSSDFGYPHAVQLADGRILVVQYYRVGSFLTNLEQLICTEDYVLNSVNVYSACDSFDAAWSAHGADATIDTTTKKGGSGSIKLNNNTGIAPTAVFDFRPAAYDGSSVCSGFAFSAWVNSGAVSASPVTTEGPTLFDGTNSRCNVSVFHTTYHLEWYNNAAWQDTGVAVTLGTWFKLSGRARVIPSPSSVSGKLYKDNVDLGTTWGQYQAGAAGKAAYQLKFQAGITAGTANTVMNLDDVYTQQYAPTAPTVAFGTPGSDAGGAALLAGM